MTKFKLGLSIIFSLFIVIAIVVFATSKGVESKKPVTLTVWGFLPRSTFEVMKQNSSLDQNKLIIINYVEKTPQNFENDFINALANEVGPDVVMISQDMVLKNKNKLFIIPYKNYTERTFKDSFIQAGELFLSPDGVVALPVMVDPLVMYWNRDIYNSAGIALPPKYFDEFLTLPGSLSKIDRSGNILQSAVSFGGWQNINNAKAIFSDLVLSAGGNVVSQTDFGELQSKLLDTYGQPVSPAQSSINFFTQFSNPTSQTYSWNRSLPNSLDYFLSGNLAIYFGFASELPKIRAKNPNLNFDVALMPQARQSNKKVVFGNVSGFSIVKQSKNVSADFQVISALTEDAPIAELEAYTTLPPVKRSLISKMPSDAYRIVFYQSALYATGWLDPDTNATDQVFGRMIDSVNSGRQRTSDALSQAHQELTVLLGQ